MRIYLGESAAESPTPPFPLTSCLVSDGWTTPHLVSMIWKDMLVNDEHLTKVCDDWMPHIYWRGTKTSFEVLRINSFYHGLSSCLVHHTLVKLR